MLTALILATLVSKADPILSPSSGYHEKIKEIG